MLSLWRFSTEAPRHCSIQAFQRSSTLAVQHVGTPTKDRWFSFAVLVNINAFLRLLLWRKVYGIKGFWHYEICNASSSSIESVVLDPMVQKLWGESSPTTTWCVSGAGAADILGLVMLPSGTCGGAAIEELVTMWLAMGCQRSSCWGWHA